MCVCVCVGVGVCVWGGGGEISCVFQLRGLKVHNITHLPSGWGLSLQPYGWVLQYFYGHHLGCLKNPIFSNLVLCAHCWAHFMCHHELWPTWLSHPFPFLNSSFGYSGRKHYQKLLLLSLDLFFKFLLFPCCFPFVLFTILFVFLRFFWSGFH